jgi:hypothetical protein
MEFGLKVDDSTFIRARCCNSICSPRRRNSFTMAIRYKVIIVQAPCQKRRESPPLHYQCSLLYFVLHMEGFASVTAARRGRETATRQRQRRAGICRSRRPNFSPSFLFSCYRTHLGTKRSCRSYFSFPRGYDMTSN